MPYSFRVVHCQGRQNPADYCSRHSNPSTQCSERTTKITEEYINLIVGAMPPAMNTDMIKHHTMNDQVLQRILKLIRSNKWQAASSDADLRPFYNIRDELCTNADNDIILRGTRIVLPPVTAATGHKHSTRRPPGNRANETSAETLHLVSKYR